MKTTQIELNVGDKTVKFSAPIMVVKKEDDVIVFEIDANGMIFVNGKKRFSDEELKVALLKMCSIVVENEQLSHQIENKKKELKKIQKAIKEIGKIIEFEERKKDETTI